jgi:hypothetical protein
MQFYKGLYDNVKDKLSKHNRNKFTILIFYIDKAIRIDNKLYERKLEYKDVLGKPLVHFTLANHGKKRSTAYRHHSKPMDLDTTQYDNKKNDKKCFNYRLPGYFMNKYRKLKKKGD